MWFQRRSQLRRIQTTLRLSCHGTKSQRNRLKDRSQESQLSIETRDKVKNQLQRRRVRSKERPRSRSSHLESSIERRATVLTRSCQSSQRRTRLHSQKRLTLLLSRLIHSKRRQRLSLRMSQRPHSSRNRGPYLSTSVALKVQRRREGPRRRTKNSRPSSLWKMLSKSMRRWPAITTTTLSIQRPSQHMATSMALHITTMATP